MWRPVTTGTPVDSHIELDNPLANTRTKLSREAFAHALLGRLPPSTAKGLEERGLNVDRVERDYVETLPAWHHGGWGLSLSYYLWSRREHFIDDGPGGEQTRLRALGEMRQGSPPPQAPTPTSQSELLVLPMTPISVTRGNGAALLSRESVFRPRGSALTTAHLGMLFGKGAERFRAARAVADSPVTDADLLISFGSAIDIYLLQYQESDCPAGVYRYEPSVHGLSLQTSGSPLIPARHALLSHPDPTDAAGTVVIVADFGRYQWRYRHERALRNLWIDAGRILHELLVVAASFGAQTGLTPAVDDSAFCDLLGLCPGDQQVLHTLTLAAPPPE